MFVDTYLPLRRRGRLFLRRYLPRRDQPVDVQEVIQSIKRAVAKYHELGVYAVVLLKPGGIPKTSSGKMQRSVSLSRLRTQAEI